MQTLLIVECVVLALFAGKGWLKAIEHELVCRPYHRVRAERLQASSNRCR
jgi:hypothetical protein